MGERIDKKHRFPLRIEEGLYRDCKALCLNHDVSMNLLLNEMIMFAKSSGTFQNFLNKEYPLDDRHGHFIHVRERG
jgi:hypothetical protein